MENSTELLLPTVYTCTVQYYTYTHDQVLCEWWMPILRHHTVTMRVTVT